MKKLLIGRFNFLSLLILLLLFQDCHVQLVSDYDQSTVDAIIDCYKAIDNFYNGLLDYPEDQRAYFKFITKYSAIESELRILLLKNSIRPLNSESTQMTQNIINLWTKYRDKHKKNNDYKGALITIHRNRFFQMFRAMLTAEKYKPQKSDED